MSPLACAVFDHEIAAVSGTATARAGSAVTTLLCDEDGCYEGMVLPVTWLMGSTYYFVSWLRNKNYADGQQPIKPPDPNEFRLAA